MQNNVPFSILKDSGLDLSQMDPKRFCLAPYNKGFPLLEKKVLSRTLFRKAAFWVNIIRGVIFGIKLELWFEVAGLCFVQNAVQLRKFTFH